MEENKFQRIRRTRTEMKTDVLNAVSQLSKEKQLSLITMVDVSKCSGIRVDVLQRLLVWELAEDNPTTRRLATSREQFYAEVFAGYKHLFEGTGLHIDIISALIMPVYTILSFIASVLHSGESISINVPNVNASSKPPISCSH